jgi:hypothetical protein
MQKSKSDRPECLPERSLRELTAGEIEKLRGGIVAVGHPAAYGTHHAWLGQKKRIEHMRQNPRKKSVTSDKKIRSIRSSLLSAVRGGEPLGITVQVPPLQSPGMESQHNETLVRA